jgi:CheY-like chemotaxis protein
MNTVLIIDDDRALVRLIQRILHTHDPSIALDMAYSGQEALVRLGTDAGRQPPDAILLDLSMPGMGGREFFQLARERGYAGPIIFCSAYGAAEANAELGGQGALNKPFEPDDLISAVSKQLASR